MIEQHAIGIDIGGTSIKYGICSSEGKIIIWNSDPTQADAPREEILEHLVSICRRTIEEAKSRAITLTAIGIGTPGCVDIRRGYLMGSTPNFAHWRDAPVGEHMEGALELPVFVDNDANMMAYGEFKFGAGRGKGDVVCITLGTGIGGGIIINHELYRGSFYSGSELGHMTIDFRGRKCNCGGTGCFERYGSATALIQDYNEAAPESPADSTIEIFKRMKNGDVKAGAVIDLYVKYVAAGLASIVNIFNPERVIIGGGVSEAGEPLISRIRSETASRAMESSIKNVEIVGAKLGNRAGILGAAASALDEVQRKRISSG